MGGCRCSYRNCTVKTDGKTHMFHYPVFEKVRCHQWLVNARKLEFLNLKVSQLKNRVVCQHHFKEDHFMNYMKDKLTFDAIPTEDGPYCDTSKLNDKNFEEKPYSNLILLEDIETDYLFGNKKANFSLKYGDFLTNGELMDSSAKYNSNNIENVSSTNYNNLLKMRPMKPQPARLSVIPKKDSVTNNQIVIQQNPCNSINHRIDENISKTLNNIELNKVNITQSQPLYQEQNLSSEVSVPQTNQSQPESKMKKEPKVKILYETKINWPLPIKGKFEKISPATTIYIPENKNDPLPKTSSGTAGASDDKAANDFKVLEVLDVEFIPQEETVESVNKNVIIPSPKTPNTAVTQPLRIFPNKSKLTPERRAAIEKKRNFNMKLKNVIESCLTKLDDPIKNYEKPNNKTAQKSILKDVNMQVRASPVKDEPMKNFQERTIAFMESRMNKMEETLLSRIDRNAHNIMELKNTFHNIKSKDKKLVNDQANTSEECYKKFLYREISPYLSENAKSLIYEELFINKYAVTPRPNAYNRKRRKVCI